MSSNLLTSIGGKRWLSSIQQKHTATIGVYPAVLDSGEQRIRIVQHYTVIQSASN